MLEEHQDWDLGAIVLVTVLQHADHAVAVHRLSGEELQVLEAAHDVLGGLVHVGLEGVHLVRIVLGQFVNNPGELIKAIRE